MNFSRRLAEKVRRGEPIPAPLAALLNSLTPLVRTGMAWRMRLPRFRVDARVISFGNITAGGTGKTPAVIERARQELAAGRRVAVLTRGYGTRTRGPIVVDRTDAPDARAARIGDEPALILRRAPGVVIVKAPDRREGARRALERGCDTLILDDGFQYVQLERDEDIVLVDAARPFGNGHLIPRGTLREPPESLARATAIYLTRCDRVDDLGPLLETIATLAPSIPVRITRHAPTALWRVSDGQTRDLADLRGLEIVAACAIAEPESFFAMLESLGARIRARHDFPDHAPFNPRSIETRLPVVVTEKDAVRIRRPLENVWALGIELRDEPEHT